MDETFTIAEIATNSIGESLKKRCSHSSLTTWLRKVEIVVAFSPRWPLPAAGLLCVSYTSLNQCLTPEHAFPDFFYNVFAIMLPN